MLSQCSLLFLAYFFKTIGCERVQMETTTTTTTTTTTKERGWTTKNTNQDPTTTICSSSFHFRLCNLSDFFPSSYQYLRGGHGDCFFQRTTKTYISDKLDKNNARSFCKSRMGGGQLVKESVVTKQIFDTTPDEMRT